MVSSFRMQATWATFGGFPDPLPNRFQREAQAVLLSRDHSDELPTWIFSPPSNSIECVTYGIGRQPSGDLDGMDDPSIKGPLGGLGRDRMRCGKVCQQYWQFTRDSPWRYLDLTVAQEGNGIRYLTVLHLQPRSYGPVLRRTLPTAQDI
jgi:hypothetical protein